MAHPGGRPTKYKGQETIDEMLPLFAQGMCIEEVAVEMRLSFTTIYNWEKEHPEFLKAIEAGKKLELAWWQKQAREALRDKDFNATLWDKSTRGRFPEKFRERHDVNLGGQKDNPIQIVKFDGAMIVDDIDDD